MKQLLSPLLLLLFLLLGACASAPPGRTVYLLGDFSPANERAELVRWLEANGHTVVQTIDDSVELVVVGRNPRGADGAGAVPLDELPDYNTAIALDLDLVAARDLPARLGHGGPYVPTVDR